MNTANTEEQRDIKDSIREFLDIINTKEESPNGNPFHPVRINSCRVALSERMSEVLREFEYYVNQDDKTP